MTWHILGAGSLGCLWAARLAAQQQSVHLILRNADAIARYRQTQGIGLSDAQRQQTNYYPVSAELATDTKPIQYLLLACKAYDAEAAISQLADRLTCNSVIILLQNGLGSQQAIQNMLPKIRCIAASSTEGAYLAAPFHSVFAGHGQTWLGDLQPSAQPNPDQLLQICNSAGIPCSWTPHITENLWRKLAINCVINPMTVIYDCSNGDLARYPEQVNILCYELQQLLGKAGQSAAAKELQQHVWTAIKNTAANSSSMRQDVLNKRRTEISYITGFACTQSSTLECRTPALHTVHAQLQDVLRRHGLAVN